MLANMNLPLYLGSSSLWTYQKVSAFGIDKSLPMLGIGIAVNFRSTSLVFQYHYALDLVSGVVFYRSDALPVTEPYSCTV